MKTLVIVSHPALAESATQQFLQASAAPLPDVTWHHLDAEPTAAGAEQAQLAAADRIVLQFPLYWYAAPASLHAWLERVWTGGFAYAPQRLAGKSLGLVVSFGQPAAAYQLGGSVGVSLSALLSSFSALAKKTGMTLLAPLAIAQFDYMTETQRAALLVQYQQYLTLATPARFEAQAAWWQAQLASRQAPTIALMAEELAARQDRLADLQQTLQEMKGATPNE